MSLATKTSTLILICIFCLSSFSQSLEEANEQEGDNSIKDHWSFQSRLLAIGGGITEAMPTGDKFVGQALDGETGFNFNVQLYVYKQFFINAALGQNYFSTNQPMLIGNYQRTTVNYEYISIGYEFIPLKKLRLGVSMSLIGDVSYKNRYNSREVYQVDTGNINLYQLYIDYEAFPFMALYASYSYRNDKMNIKTAEEIGSFFERAQFHNLGAGIKFYIGSNSLIQ